MKILQWGRENKKIKFFFIFIKKNFFCLFAFSRATPMSYGGFQARVLIGAVPTSLHQSHSNARSETRL